MNLLLDTNVVSELRKPPRLIDPGVAAWAENQNLVEQWLSAITVMEIAIGVGRIRRRDPDQGRRLDQWVNDSILAAFRGRILPVDLRVALRAADLHVPDPRPERDTLIAATALVHGLTVVTRNAKDFDRLGVRSLDPWRAL
ncbi:MAG: type II toxin-antitoxin system VapC family toxin [Bifidobacteriaceae bacterium]|jgi:predicted nucleic acid-binding protein|nr:type II toxin-antitoxin system VapC family toxin [Bifidobacteriaceae bacterium]